jgi:benzoate-CoA ligase family protein
MAAPDEVAFWLYSSGSTGAPKGVRHVHSSLRVTAENYGRSVLGIRPDDVMFSVAKAFHAYGLGNSLTFPQSVGAATVLLPDRPTPDAVLGVMAQHQPTLFAGVPTLYAAMLANPMLTPNAGSAGLRRCISAGEALPADIGRRWKSLVGVDILDGIGSTEMLHIFISNHPGDIRYGTTGKPVPGYEARILDDDGNVAKPGTVGRLAVRGPTGCRYLADERQKKYVQDGWNVTGDTYLMDSDGYFWYQARSDDMIISAGYNIAGPEVEAALLTHAAVAECGVVGCPDEERGQVVKAYVVLRVGMTGDAGMIKTLQDHVKATVAPYKYPRAIEFVTELPKTQTGKLQRFELRRMAAAGASQKLAS